MAEERDLVDELELRRYALDAAIQAYHHVSHFLPSDIVGCARVLYEFLTEGCTAVTEVELEEEGEAFQ